MHKYPWKNSTIAELESQHFGEPNEAPTAMTKRCLELCKVPLHQFSIEDLRLMIGQEFSLVYLVPLAIEALRTDIFVEGNYYPGDLLNAVLSIDRKFWSGHSPFWNEVNELIAEQRDQLAQLKISTAVFDSVIAM